MQRNMVPFPLSRDEGYSVALGVTNLIILTHSRSPTCEPLLLPPAWLLNRKANPACCATTRAAVDGTFEMERLVLFAFISFSLDVMIAHWTPTPRLVSGCVREWMCVLIWFITFSRFVYIVPKEGIRYFASCVRAKNMNRYLKDTHPSSIGPAFSATSDVLALQTSNITCSFSTIWSALGSILMHLKSNVYPAWDNIYIHKTISDEGRLRIWG